MMDMGKFEQGLVSVVTPVYNGENYIHLLLNSILDQTYDNIQMILADDGSDDRTIEIAEGFRAAFEKRGYSLEIVSGNHSCASAAMGNGLPLVRGEYLIWPDGDDELLPDSIEKRVSFLKEHPEAKCVRSNRVYVDIESGESVNPLERTGNLKPHNIFLEMLFGETFVCCGCYMLRSREFFEIYPEGKIPVYQVGQNFQMLLPFMYHYDCHTIDLPLYKVNRRKDSHSARPLTKEEEYKKYRDYESLIDEIAGIANITDRDSLTAIEKWKYKRQTELFFRHKDMHALRKSHKAARQLGLITSRECGKGIVMTTYVGSFFQKLTGKIRRRFFRYRMDKRERYLEKQRKRLEADPICLICCNCIGGSILHDLNRPFLSPFVNLMIQPKDFLKMLKSLPEYMASELVFIEQDKYDYPLAMLKDIMIYFVHYESETQAREKWIERTKRMDYNHLYILFCDRNGATEEDLVEFDQLPYEHKAVLVHEPRPDLKSAVYLRGYEKQNEIGMLIAYNNKFSYKKKYDAFDYVSWFNGDGII